MSLTVLAGVYLLVRRFEAVADLPGGDAPAFTALYTAMFAWLGWRTVLAYSERPHRADPADQAELDRAHVAVLVPVFNEDPGWLRRCLASLLEQTRPPDSVHVVDDGSKVDYRHEREWFEAACRDAGVAVSWRRTPNRGKRAAQVSAAERAPEADFFLTVDSDTDLDTEAVAELLRPFRDPRVQSVAGVVMAANAGTNLLTRCTDLYMTTWQLNERSAQSVLGSVLVNTGVLAAYRAAVVREHARTYLAETFLGRRVDFSDDSMLTLFAKLRGRTVQQPSALGLAAMPETLDHHLRQQLRWMRGSAIRTCWRLRYLPLTGYAFWLQTAHLFTAVTGGVLFGWLFLWQPFTVGVPPWLLLLVPTVVSYVEALRYLTVRRHDHSLRRQLAVVALAPLVLLWGMTVLRALKWYGALTCARTGWGTRQDVELALTPAPGRQGRKPR
ncbi:glycosyltransferase family 2 protein [Kitasatospora sp. NPDC057198]|uniref:glycosyltransferase family 2 protein n=1 Tax=Kitasatospora sp. NPDC057198 TaxID=3346046 RepID=UPI0036417E4F